MRRFIRHPSDMPINIGLREAAKPDQAMTADSNSKLHNLSQGGICCTVNYFIATGTKVFIKIPALDTDYEGHGVTAWCQPLQQHQFDIGITFTTDDDAFNYRMVEQLCLIEKYRQHAQEHEGRLLTTEQAAQEWISKYAAIFPDMLH